MGSSDNMVMPVSPMLGGNSGFGGWGDNGAWWLLILLFAMGGWGNGFGGYGAGFANEAMWPYFYNNQTQNDVNRGFSDLHLSDQLTALQGAVNSGFGDTALGIAGVNQNICQTGNGIVNALNTGFSQAEIAANARQMADMQQAFNSQTAITAGMNNLAMGLQNCCCENRAATADLKYTVATEACADRQAVSDALRDVIAANTASTQKILDQMCQDKIDAKNEKITELQNKLTMAELRANNNQQTQTLLADNLAQTANLEQYLAPVPRPAYVVQNPNCCGNFNYGCGCGM